MIILTEAGKEHIDMIVAEMKQIREEYSDRELYPISCDYLADCDTMEVYQYVNNIMEETEIVNNEITMNFLVTDDLDINFIMIEGEDFVQSE